VLALFPGSRVQEIKRHLKDFVETASRLESQFKDLRVIVSAASTVDIPREDCPYQIVDSDPFTVLRAADAALCKSGTTTLEAAICGCPLVVAYRTGTISYLLARQFVKIPHIALVNVVAGREVAKEFVQDDLDPERVATALVPLLTIGSPERDKLIAGLNEVRGKLGEPGAAARVARMASEMVK
jgi:lipid-A-disaccharide synthase